MRSFGVPIFFYCAYVFQSSETTVFFGTGSCWWLIGMHYSISYEKIKLRSLWCGIY